MNKDMISYYEERAMEYDKVYSNPAEQDDLKLVLKNFPTQDFLIQKLTTIATKIEFIPLKFYWIVTCQLKNNVNHI